MPEPLTNSLHRLDALLQQIESFTDAPARAKTREIVQAIMDLHSTAIERMLERIAASNKSSVDLIDSLAEDELVSNILILYGLHPLDLETRVLQALDKCRPYLRSHGGNVELLGIRDGVVRLRLEGSCHGCPSSAQTLRQTIEESVTASAPDVTAIEVEGEDQPPVQEAVTSSGRSGFSLPILR